MEMIIFVVSFFIIQIIVEKVKKFSELQLKQIILSGLPASIVLLIIAGFINNRLLVILFFSLWGSLIVSSMRRSVIVR